MEEPKSHIYILIDPFTSLVRYVGQSVNPMERYFRHAKYKSNENNKKASWIKSLKKKNAYPLLEIIDSVELEMSSFWEQHYISLYKSWGFNLTNMTEGGEKPPRLFGDKNPMKNKEIAKRVAATKIGHIKSIETRKKLSETHKRIGSKPPSRKGISLSTDVINKIVSTRMRNGCRRKPFFQLTLQGDILRRFEYGKDLKNTYPSYSMGTINNVCRGERNTAYGFKWRFVQ